jgi:uncharacterized protein (DUF2384 family)
MIPQAYFNKVKTFFKGDAKKAWTWFNTPNPCLGSVSPRDMIKAGRENKLKKFIDDAIEDNKRWY